MLLLPISASAQAPRFALVVGSNRGNNPAKSLRYAQRDADRFAEVLQALGGFEAADVRVLKNPRKSDFQAGLQLLHKHVKDRAHTKNGGSLALVYFSGHADGVNLELGDERLPFAELRRSLETLGADVNILIMDSCQSGGVTTYKGGRPGPSFDIVFTDTIDANGTAVLTSSAAGEKSQESGRLMGSFFTHFLVSGLSGTADFDQDQRVTLNEIYQYTYNKTVAETSRTMGGTQHPTYDFRITGRGNVVLTDLSRGTAAIQFGSQMQGTYIILKERTDEVATEVTKPAKVRRTAALPPGNYRVAISKKGTVYSASVHLEKGERIQLADTDFAPEPRLKGIFDKGSEPETRRGLGLEIYYGLLSGALKRYTALHEAIITLRVDVNHFTFFPKASVGSTHIDEDGFKYRLLLITGEGAVAWRFEKSPLDLFLGLNLGGGYGRQELSSSQRTGSMFIYGLLCGLEYRFSRRFALSVFWEVGSHVYRAENQLTQSLLLRGSIGAGVHF